VFRFESSPVFARALREGDQELAPPSGESVGEGEWVLAIFEMGERRRATAAAARGLVRGTEAVLAFERRDWERLLDFAEAGSFGMVAAVAASPKSVPPPGPSDRPTPMLPSSRPSSPPAHRTAVGLPAVEAPEPSLERTAYGMPEIPRTPPLDRTSLGLAPSTAPSTPSVPGAAGPTHRSLDRTSLGLSSEPPPPPAIASRAPSTGKTQAWPVLQPANPASPAARVLVVDDDRNVCEIVAAMLEAVGLAVQSSPSAESALESLRASRYDLLVLDWNLPGMTGIELCRLLRKDDKLHALPVIFLSGRTESQDIVDAFASGADDYVSKPFRAPELGARIFGLLRRARMVADVAR